MRTKQLKKSSCCTVSKIGQGMPWVYLSIFHIHVISWHLMASHGKSHSGCLAKGRGSQLWLSWLLWGLSLRSMTLHRRGAHLDAFAFLLWQNDPNLAIKSNQNRFESFESLESNALEVQVNWGFWGGDDLSEIVDGRDPDGRLKMDGALWSVVAATVNSDRVWNVVVTCVSRLTARYFFGISIYIYIYIIYIYMYTSTYYISHIIYHIYVYIIKEIYIYI